MSALRLLERVRDACCSWIGEYLYSSPVYNTAKATGIVINSNDHYINVWQLGNLTGCFCD